MSTAFANTQSSEHAKFAGQAWLSPDNYPWSDLKKLIWHIDQHAIAPAVAERDKRIAELEELLGDIYGSTVDTPMYPDGPCIDKEYRQQINALLAKKGQP